MFVLTLLSTLILKEVGIGCKPNYVIFNCEKKSRVSMIWKRFISDHAMSSEAITDNIDTHLLYHDY